ncbi:MAG: ABC transporter permease [Anaerolineaceae bacterium]|nr:ABC transporter permease [Anaerolineaceae bacterium]
MVFGKVEGWAGTDYLRRDLLIPLLWGLPLALFIGVFGALFTSLISLILAAASAWLGGWVDFVVQHATEANLILPVLAVGVLLYSYYNLSLWLIIGIIILANVLGSSTKVMRAAFLQEKQAGYVEAAKSYGASDWRIIRHYLVPRIMPVIIPQIVMLIPGFIFLEATLAIFTIYDTRYPTWGRIIYSALHNGALYGSQFWVLEPITLMLLTGLAFVLISFGLNHVLAPHLQSD